MKYKEGAIVVGGHFQGLGLVRALASEGVKVVLLDFEPCLGRFSRYIDKFFKCPSVLKEDMFFDFLLDLADRERMKGWFIFPTDDETVFSLSRNKTRLDEMYRVTTPEWNVVKFAYDKKLSYRLAEKIGIPIPRTVYPESIDDLDNIGLPFPVIVKPSVMRNFFRVTGKKVYRARDRDELLSMYQKASSIINASEILIQEEIPDVANNLYSFCPMFKEKKVLGRIVAKRSRQHPMDFGHASTFAETVYIPKLEILGSRVLSAMDFYGLCEVEFIKDPRDGRFKFLEVNPRVWGWHTLAIRAGVNLPYMVYCDMMGQKVNNDYFKEGVKWVRLVTDVLTVFSEISKNRMGIKDYVKSLRGEKEFAVFSLRDPLPFIGELFMLPYMWRKRGF